MRKQTREVSIGKVKIGSDHPIIIQSMTNTDTNNIDLTVAQIKRLEDLGCELVRISVYDLACAEKIREIKRQINIPLVADIHFDPKIAIASIENGADKIRINPGNIGTKKDVANISVCATEYGIPIRVGINGGSLESDILAKHKHPTAQALFESAVRNIGILEDLNFDNIVISLKSSDVATTIKAYRFISEYCNYPLHLGVTEAGTINSSQIKSSVALGSLLIDGIGDTIRVSVTGAPELEIKLAQDILNLCNIRRFSPIVISCPTCSRTSLETERIASEIEKSTAHLSKNIKIAVMGCVVNGIGEGREADIGVAGGNNDKCALFAKGEFIKTIHQQDAVSEILSFIENNF